MNSENLETCRKCDGTGLIKDHKICTRCAKQGKVKWTQNILKQDSDAVHLFNDVIDRISMELEKRINQSIHENLKKERKMILYLCL